MSTVITAGNATTGLSFSADNAGTFEFKTGTGSGTTALSIDASQNVTIAGALTVAKGISGTPAFSAYSSNSQTIATGTFVKMQINTEEFDTANCFDNATNYRFTPTVAGYYQVNGHIGFTTSVTAPQLGIYKNGSQFKFGTNYAASGNWSSVAALIYLNGTTDYIELYGAHITGTTQTLLATSQYNYFQASLVRGA